MKTVHDSQMVAHLWANQSQNHATNPRKSFYFNGATIYSYDESFAIARHVGGVVLVTTRKFSVTTSKHVDLVRRSLAKGGPVFYVDYPEREGHKEHLANYGRRILQAGQEAAHARTNKDWKLGRLLEIVGEANAYAAHFRLKTRFSVPTDIDLSKASDSAKRAETRKRREEAATKLRFEAECQVDRERWLSGETVYYPRSHDGDIRLRVVGDEVQTSRGARFSVDHARRALSVIRSGVPYQHSGHSIHLGRFRIDSIDAAGNVTAGCHVVKREEIERVALILGI